MTLEVLVIDDDEAIRMSVSIVLEAHGYIVHLAEDGASGFDQFVRVRPQVVISDMIMPGHQSIQTITKIRALDPAVSIIAMSGSIQGGPDSYLEKARIAGASHYLEKPFEPAQLLGLLKLAGSDPE